MTRTALKRQNKRLRRQLKIQKENYATLERASINRSAEIKTKIYYKDHLNFLRKIKKEWNFWLKLKFLFFDI
jgi:hypothetical protein